ncbi:MAG: hypothetical protein BWY71_01643 [Planctomycetes bacterium ADurb.Bin412]|nr:MAG: hypothetical protein BWY71_01643 [Planctomycetes bacterium ADurb.Bin412]
MDIVIEKFIKTKQPASHVLLERLAIRKLKLRRNPIIPVMC